MYSGVQCRVPTLDRFMMMCAVLYMTVALSCTAARLADAFVQSHPSIIAHRWVDSCLADCCASPNFYEIVDDSHEPGGVAEQGTKRSSETESSIRPVSTFIGLQKVSRQHSPQTGCCNYALMLWECWSVNVLACCAGSRHMQAASVVKSGSSAAQRGPHFSSLTAQELHATQCNFVTSLVQLACAELGERLPSKAHPRIRRSPPSRCHVRCRTITPVFKRFVALPASDRDHEGDVAEEAAGNNVEEINDTAANDPVTSADLGFKGMVGSNKRNASKANVPIDLPSYALLAASTVVAIAFVGSIFEAFSPQPVVSLHFDRSATEVVRARITRYYAHCRRSDQNVLKHQHHLIGARTSNQSHVQAVRCCPSAYDQLSSAEHR